MEDKLHIYLFGKFRIQRGDREPAELSSAKAQELFCYLLLNRTRPHPRESLANVLWDKVSMDQSKGYLRKALWQLQTTLGRCNKPEYGDVLLIEPDWIQINPDVNCWLDVALFEQAFNLAQGVPGRELQFSSVQELQNAVGLYRGDLLDGWYLEWCLYERERLQRMYLIMLDKLMDYCEAQRQYENGLAYGTRILRYDKARERTHRRLMRLYYLAGYRTEALRQCERCVAILDEELDVKPARRTMDVYEQIRADQLDVSTSPVSTDYAASEATASTLAEVVAQLRHLQVELSSVQHQVHQKIETVEMILNNW